MFFPPIFDDRASALTRVPPHSGQVWNVTDYPASGVTETYARGINDSGEIVGYYKDGTGFHGYTLMNGNFTSYDFPGSSGYTVFSAVNNLGQIAGYYESPNTGGYDNGFVLNPNGSLLPVNYGGAGTDPSGINNNGLVVGNTYSGSGGYQGFTYNILTNT